MHFCRESTRKVYVLQLDWARCSLLDAEEKELARMLQKVNINVIYGLSCSLQAPQSEHKASLSNHRAPRKGV
jgi:hypothetical protein